MSWKDAWKGKDPKKPKEEKQSDKPLVRDLRGIYKLLISMDDGQRISSLAQALQWYDKAIPYIITRHGSRNSEQSKAWDVAAKCRQRGMSTTFNGEKETSFVMALKRYEKVIPEIWRGKEPAKIEDYYEQFTEGQERLKLKQQSLEERFGNVVEMLNTALKPLNADGQPVTIKIGQVQQSYQMDPQRSQLTLNRNMIKELRTMVRVEGLLVVVMELIEPLAKLCVMRPETDGNGTVTGRYIATEKEQRQMEHKLIWSLIDFCKTSAFAPKRLVKPKMLVHKPKLVGERKAGGFAGGPTRGPKRAGLFVDGTAIAKVFEQMLDGQPHGLKDLQSMIPAQIQGRLQVIDKYGRRAAAINGMGFQVRVSKGQAQLEWNVPEAHEHFKTLWAQPVGA